jgi:Uma2 family endonuclease
MSIAPYDRCRYTVEEFAALPEDNSMRYELVETRIVASPRPAMPHMIVVSKLIEQLGPQLPANLLAVPEIDVDLRLTPPVVRIPDLVIVDVRVAGEPGLVKASDVVLAVEVISPSSLRTDTKVKPLEYADAGIPHLWLIDPRSPVTVTAYRLVGGDYEESLRAERELCVDEPCALRIDLEVLLPVKFSVGYG